jgi:hypothetical protein
VKYEHFLRRINGVNENSSEGGESIRILPTGSATIYELIPKVNQRRRHFRRPKAFISMAKDTDLFQKASAQQKRARNTASKNGTKKENYDDEDESDGEDDGAGTTT